MAVGVVVALSTPARGLAQDGAVGLAEVVVTAQRREQSLQDVGIAVSAFSGEQLRELGITRSTDVAFQTPGVYVSGDGGGNQQQFTIRGSTQSDFSILAEGPNALYVDDAYQVTQLGQMFALFDIDRVEVLKGPQGTLFGRNATGGLIHFVTKRPTREFEGYADVAFGRFDSLRLEAAFGGPLAEGLSGRVSAFHYSHDPIYDNAFSAAGLPPTPQFLAAQGRGPLTVAPGERRDVFQADQWALRGQLLWEPTDRTSLLAQAHYAHSDPGPPPYHQRGTVAFVADTNGDGVEGEVVDTAFAGDVPANQRLCEQISISTGNCVNSVFDLDFDGVRPGATGDFWGYVPPNGLGGRKVEIDHAPADSNDRQIHGLNLHVTHDFENVRLAAVTSWAEQEKRQSLDVDSGPVPQFIVMDEMQFDWITQELRLEGDTQRSRWLAGAYFLSSEGLFSQGLADSLGGLNVFGGLFFNGFLPAAGPNEFLEATFDARLKTDSYSLFGHVDFDLTETLELTIGVRGIVEEKDYVYRNRLYRNERDNRVDSAQFAGAVPLRLPGALGGGVFDFLPPHEERTSDFLWSARTSLQWRPYDGLMLYGGVNRGVKAGSFNSPLLTQLTPEEYGYEEEVLMAYEAGFKSTLWQNRVRLNGAFYYYDYNDYQAFQFIGTSGAVFNVDAKYKGFELELVAQPADGVDVGIGIAYIDATVEDLLVAPNTRRDVRPTYTPKTKFNYLVGYRLPSTLFGGNLRLRFDGSYASSTYNNINNFGSHRMDAYWLGNARVSWQDADERYEFALFASNVFDETYQIQGFELSTICGCDEAAFGPPRIVGLQGRVRF
ncbi:MAG: TonB-dependent receptor [Steroidobacteraceae bacterium]|nr:TonB-dependent receptor [Steroidobacteraceae bacterium]